MASAMYTDVKRKSRDGTSTFIRPHEGLFGLREWIQRSIPYQVCRACLPPCRPCRGCHASMLCLPRSTAAHVFVFASHGCSHHQAMRPSKSMHDSCKLVSVHP